MKTPALDFLVKNKADFKQYSYESSSDHHDFGKHAALALGMPEAKVFKTIILHHDKTYVTCIVPVSGRISMKAAARAVKLKDLETVDPATWVASALLDKNVVDSPSWTALLWSRKRS